MRASDGAAARRAPTASASCPRAGEISAMAPSAAVPAQAGTRRSSTGSGARPSPRLPSWSSPITRSCHLPPRRSSCRIAMASKNSLAMSSIGPGGTVVEGGMPGVGCRRAPASGAGPAMRGLFRRDGIRKAASKAGAMRQVRRRSAISVPRPGPSSTRRTGRGRPIASRSASTRRRSARRTSGEISGAVMKSPCGAEAACGVSNSRGGDGRGIGHEAVDRYRA